MWTRIEVVAAFAASVGITLTVLGTPNDSSFPYRAIESTAAVSFADEIMPIFEASCVQCHGGKDENGVETIEAGLYLTSYEKVMAGSEFGSVVDPGDVESILLVMVEEGDMPEDGDPLTPEQIDLIRTWITEGAENN